MKTIEISSYSDLLEDMPTIASAHTYLRNQFENVLIPEIVKYVNISLVGTYYYEESEIPNTRYVFDIGMDAYFFVQIKMASAKSNVFGTRNTSTFRICTGMCDSIDSSEYLFMFTQNYWCVGYRIDVPLPEENKTKYKFTLSDKFCMKLITDGSILRSIYYFGNVTNWNTWACSANVFDETIEGVPCFWNLGSTNKQWYYFKVNSNIESYGELQDVNYNKSPSNDGIALFEDAYFMVDGNIGILQYLKKIQHASLNSAPLGTVISVEGKKYRKIYDVYWILDEE